jgi:hypothetical protein
MVDCVFETAFPNFNPLNAELNPICHFLALLGGANIVVVSRLRVKTCVILKELKHRKTILNFLQRISYDFFPYICFRDENSLYQTLIRNHHQK